MGLRSVGAVGSIALLLPLVWRAQLPDPTVSARLLPDTSAIVVMATAPSRPKRMAYFGQVKLVVRDANVRAIGEIPWSVPSGLAILAGQTRTDTVSVPPSLRRGVASVVIGLISFCGGPPSAVARGTVVDCQ